MKYILLIHSDEQAWNRLSDGEQRQIMAEYAQLRERLKANGQFLDGSRLHGTPAATCVRVRDGRRLVTDGPFAETREQLAGYFVVEVKDLDDAIGIVAQMPGAGGVGTVEVRPLAEPRQPTG